MKIGIVMRFYNADLSSELSLIWYFIVTSRCFLFSRLCGSRVWFISNWPGFGYCFSLCLQRNEAKVCSLIKTALGKKQILKQKPFTLKANHLIARNASSRTDAAFFRGEIMMRDISSRTFLHFLWHFFVRACEAGVSWLMEILYLKISRQIIMANSSLRCLFSFRLNA